GRGAGEGPDGRRAQPRVRPVRSCPQLARRGRAPRDRRPRTVRCGQGRRGGPGSGQREAQILSPAEPGTVTRTGALQKRSGAANRVCVCRRTLDLHLRQKCTECNNSLMSLSSNSQPSEPAEGLRERKKRERGQALRSAAIDLALEKGYHNVTVEDNCERYGVARRTFFNYYSSKEEALLGRADTVFDEEDQPAIEEFEAGGPHGSLIADLEHLLGLIVATRMSKRDEVHRYHLMLKQDPSLLQLQMSRMGNNERLFRQIIQRRLDGRPRSASAPAPALHEATFDSSAEDDEPVSLRAEAVAALAMMALKATFTRLRRFEGDSAPV